MIPKSTINTFGQDIATDPNGMLHKATMWYIPHNPYNYRPPLPIAFSRLPIPVSRLLIPES